MSSSDRRGFLRSGSLGIASLGLGSVLLRAAEPTPSSGELGSYGDYLSKGAKSPPRSRGAWQPTEDNILGPFYRRSAPYRAKITPPMEQGTVLMVMGRVWGYDTRKPLTHATLDVWQANAKGRYDNDDGEHPPAEDVFLNRARLVTDENGYYEFETVHPGPYQIGDNVWRPSHIHYMVQHPGYKTLVTQLYFEGDEHNKTDRFIKPSLIISVKDVKTGAGTYEQGKFDIVLAPA